MIRTSALLLCLLFLFSAAALASTSDATIVAPETLKLTAPCSGTLLPFDWVRGDSVSSEDILFSYQTNPIYAPDAGKVVAVYAAPGDDASRIQNHYGALAVIEPVHPLYLAANNAQAYDDDENKYLHAGEILYLKNGNDKGTGRVTSVNGDNYTVEILTGPFDPGDSVRCYRDSGHSNDSETGRGRVYRYPDISVPGQGRIVAVHAAAGTTVQTGDLLFETLDSLALPGQPLSILAGVSGVLSSVPVSSGQTVARGQLLCEIQDLSKLELSIELDEMDLPSVRVGDTLSYTLDAYPSRTFTGTVLRIYPLGTPRQNASYYDVRLSVSSEVPLYPGMNGTVTIQ